MIPLVLSSACSVLNVTHIYFSHNAFSIQRDEFYGEQRFDGSYDTSGRLQGKITD